MSRLQHADWCICALDGLSSDTWAAQAYACTCCQAARCTGLCTLAAPMARTTVARISSGLPFALTLLAHPPALGPAPPPQRRSTPASAAGQRASPASVGPTPPCTAPAGSHTTSRRTTWPVTAARAGSTRSVWVGGTGELLRSPAHGLTASSTQRAADNDLVTQAMAAQCTMTVPWLHSVPWLLNASCAACQAVQRHGMAWHGMSGNCATGSTTSAWHHMQPCADMA
jgi:hypothetical protein